MGEKTIKAADNNLPTVKKLYQMIDTQPLQDAINAFLAAWNEAIEKATADSKALYQAILDACPYLADALQEVADFWQQVLKIITQQGHERPKWRRFVAQKPRQLLLDKRSKIHRCRNAC